MKKRISRWLVAVVTCLAGNGALAVQINQTSSTNFYVDFSSDMRAAYVSYMITNTDNVTYSNLWVTIDSFTNSSMRLSSGDIGQYHLGTLTNNQGKPAFFYLQVTNDPGSKGAFSDRFTIHVYNGFPGSGGSSLTSSNFTLLVNTSGANQANKVTSLTYSPTNNPVVGGLVQITVQGTTGNVNVGNDMSFTAATFTNWNPAAFELQSCFIVITDSPNYVLSNVLDATSATHITGSGDTYVAQYWFRAVATTISNTPVSPVNYLNNGGGTINHVAESSLLALPPVIPPTNLTTMATLVSSTQIYTNEICTFTLRFTNSSTLDVTLDRIVDTLPNGFLYVSNSSSFGGAVILDPASSNQVFTWSQTYTVPARTSRDFVFAAVPTNSGYATNSAVAYIKNTQIDTTLNTSDNSPAVEVVRALIQPVATNVTNSVLENAVLTVAAPGVLSGDVEPNGFGLAVIRYTQPANGTAVVNSDGSYTYTPATNYNGSDNFTYTMTNGNGRASTASVSLTIIPVNQPPSFTGGPNETVLENGGPQTFANWASNISAGPTNESGQTVTFQAANNNNALFSVQPAVSGSGTLTFTPASDANGSATVTVYAQDNGGTANGGINTSAPQTFTVNISFVNQPPYFTKGADQSVLENAGPQTVNNWATGISPGAPNQTNETIAFYVSNNNSNLFSAQPSISSNGTLTYTPATNANGSATVTVYLQNSGGTANGGNDTSGSQIFAISVTPVNQPPTLNSLSPVSINEDAPTQTVPLSGISSGPKNESSQTVTITATSSNPTLIPNPTVSYANPASTGSLSFAPLTNGFGTSIVSVVVMDNGGTANGGVDAVTNTFTVTVNELTTIWGPNGGLTEHISDALGAPGTGYDEQPLIGNLDIQATSTNRFTIHLASLNGGLPGFATNFDYDSNYIWTIASTTRGVDEFDPSKFIFDTAGFSNDLAGGSFSTALSPDSNSVYVVFIPAHAPTADAINYGRAYGTTLRLAIPNILTNYTSDVDGAARTLLYTGASTNGSYIGTNGPFIVFSPTNNISEGFVYGVEAVLPYRPGDTLRLASNWITISVTNAIGTVQSINVVNGQGVTVRFAGVPGYAYDVQRTTNLVSPDWTVIWTTNAPPNGVWVFMDTNPPANEAYYRTRQH